MLENKSFDLALVLRLWNWNVRITDLFKQKPKTTPSILVAVGPLDKRSGLVSHVNSHLLLQVSVLNTLCQRETTCSFARHDFRQPIEPSPGIRHRARPKLCGQERPNPSPPPHTLLTAGEQQSRAKQHPRWLVQHGWNLKKQKPRMKHASVSSRPPLKLYGLWTNQDLFR